MLGTAQAARRVGEASTQFAEIIRRPIGEFLISLGPHVLGRLEFGRVRGEVVGLESRMTGEKRTNFAPAMDWTAIPEQVDRAAQMTQEVTEKGLDVEAAEVVRHTEDRASVRYPARTAPVAVSLPTAAGGGWTRENHAEGGALRMADYVMGTGTKGGQPLPEGASIDYPFNLKTGKALGLTIPPSLLGRADEVIQ